MSGGFFVPARRIRLPPNAFLQIALFCLLLSITAPMLGPSIAKIFQGEGTWLSWAVRPVEHGIYRLCGIDPREEQRWPRYAIAVLTFNLVGLFASYAVMRLQHVLPLNPADMPAVASDLAFNTAASFSTNADWQAYSGESTMSYLSQMAALTVQNFTASGTGLAVLAAVIRGFSRRSAATVGNFYADLVRSILYVLLPLSVLYALFLVWQGVPQNLDPYVSAAGLEGHTQIIAQGPVATQEAIKLLGTNGGGFFGANSAHPYENPTPLVNFTEVWAQSIIAAALLFAFGRLIGDPRQGRALFIAMGVMLLAGLFVCTWAESQTAPSLRAPGLATAGNMEGKELRHGIVGSTLFEVTTTATGTGAANASLDSFTPLGGMVAMTNMMTKEVIFGGVGSGLYGMLVDVVLAMFIAGLMVGRTPEYLGKKIESREVKLAMICSILFPLSCLGFGGLSLALPAGTAAITAQGPHGLSQALYAYLSTTANNGSIFGGFGANSLYQNSVLGFVMLAGRFLNIIPTLALAGSLAAKRAVPVSAGTFPTHGLQFVILLIGVILVVGGLSFFPVLALGPIAEHFLVTAGVSY
jgi:K+-transporting ATPase ATPase A chain